MENIIEVWKDVPDYEGLYQVSNLGRVKSIKNNKEKLMTPHNYFGYLRVYLSGRGKPKYFRIHRLVGICFVDGYFEGAQIDHIDTNRSNNVYTNLRWCSAKENCNNPLTLKHNSDSHKSIIGKKLTEEHKKKISETMKGFGKGRKLSEETRMKISEKMKGVKRQSQNKSVVQYTINHEFVNEYESITTASESTGISNGCISSCCRHRTKTAGGYIFEYKTHLPKS